MQIKKNTPKPFAQMRKDKTKAISHLRQMGAHLVQIIGRDFVFNNTRFPLSGAQDFQLMRFPLSRVPDFNCPACCAPLRSQQVNILSSDHPSAWSSDHLIAVEFHRIIIIIDRVLLIKSPRGLWIGRSQRGKFRPQIYHPLIDWHKASCSCPPSKTISTNTHSSI